MAVGSRYYYAARGELDHRSLWVIRAGGLCVLGGMDGSGLCSIELFCSPDRPGGAVVSDVRGAWRKPLELEGTPARETLLMSPASRQIVAIAADRDREAFASLFAYFAPRVKSYLMRLGTKPSLAEDLAQETLLTVWRKAGHFDPAKAQAATWIFTIARNLRISEVRRERRPGFDPEDPALSPVPPASAEESLAAAERESRIHEALATLPAEQAEVVRLSFFEEKPHQQIERDLGIPLGTVKSRLRLAMARIRRAVGEE